jgi:hypothetical protein
VNKKVVVLILGIIAVGVVGYQLVAEATNRTSIAATQSCLKSVVAYIEKTEGNGLKETAQSAQWHLLDGLQLKEILEGAERSLDCKMCRGRDVCDAWGNPLEIMWKKEDGSIHVRVSSHGPDGVKSSSDDLHSDVLLR